VDTVLDDAPDSPPVRRLSGGSGWLWLLVLVAVALAAGAWWWKSRPVADPGPDLSPAALDARLLDAEQAVVTLRRTQGSLEQKLTDTTARTGLLRDEVLGVGQRAAILEDSLRELASQATDGREALRLDEVEMLLGLAQARLDIAGDLAGAIRATAMAREALMPLTDPQFISLRQTIAQELAALRELPADPRVRAAAELDALQAALPTLSSRAPGAPVTSDSGATGWQRLLDAVVQVRPSGAQDLVSPADRATGEAALGLEIALARLALERRDEAGFRAGLERVDAWLARLYARDAAFERQAERLQALADLPLVPDLPMQGAALQQLRDLRGSSRDIEQP
jgi:uroporphyrin-3 C-methyltransferase